MKSGTFSGLLAILVTIGAIILTAGCVAPIPPTSNASVISTDVKVGENISFDGSYSMDQDGTIISYEWDFDDGDRASGAVVRHTFARPGTYLVTLIVTDNSGLKDIAVITVSVQAPSYTLNEAINSGLVTAEITGSGASSGDSIYLKLTRRTAEPLEITVPKGTVLHASGGVQDMVVWKLSGIPAGSQLIYPQSHIVLYIPEPQTFILRAYCLDFHKANPSSSTKFAVGSSADPQILKILNTVDNLSSEVASVAAIQIAIWVVTEDVSVKELHNRFLAHQEDINNAKIILEEAGIDTSAKRLFA